MAEYPTLVRSQRVIQGQGVQCDFGCKEDKLSETVAYAKQHFPTKPYCVVEGWTWVDIAVSSTEASENPQYLGEKPSILYANRVIADEAQRAHLGPLVRTSPLLEFHCNCLFVTKNTVYILYGRGNRTTVSSALVRGLIG